MKEKTKTKTPLFTFLTVLFIIVTIGVFFGLLYMTNSSRFDPKDYEDVFIDHSESAPAVIPKGAQKDTSETALLEQPKKSLTTKIRKKRLHLKKQKKNQVKKHLKNGNVLRKTSKADRHRIRGDKTAVSAGCP